MAGINESQNLRDEVSRAYARAVEAKVETKPCCGATVAPKGAVAKLAGYTAEELTALPEDAVVNSFGCGNPLAFSEVQEGQTVLDLGSGAGIDILIAGKKVGPTGKAIGIDMTDEMLARARENIAASGMEHVEVRKGIIEELPVEDGTVDWVISNCVINLSPEKEKVFAEINRVLRPGGRILVSDIVVTELPEAIRRIPEVYNSCIGGAISEEDYVQGLRDAGLSDVEVVERLVYDEPMLEGFVMSELDEGGSLEQLGCCGAKLDPEAIKGLTKTMTGKVWSAKFSATKPGA